MIEVSLWEKKLLFVTELITRGAQGILFKFKILAVMYQFIKYHGYYTQRTN